MSLGSARQTPFLDPGKQPKERNASHRLQLLISLALFTLILRIPRMQLFRLHSKISMVWGNMGSLKHSTRLLFPHLNGRNFLPVRLCCLPPLPIVLGTSSLLFSTGLLWFFSISLVWFPLQHTWRWLRLCVLVDEQIIPLKSARRAPGIFRRGY